MANIATPDDLSKGDSVIVRINRVSNSGNAITVDGKVHIKNGQGKVGEDVVVRIKTEHEPIESVIIDMEPDNQSLRRYSPEGTGGYNGGQNKEWKGENKNNLLNGHL
ncbi:hypothetical protein [Halapricum desulfuricans]|uniref:hypothetical protein n=1 Tax=Halapricum desulfuricans TaxID=2841257 RepID=UPI001E5BF1A4|nr:hypothetical protein [Halapricum desulfuricans]